MDAPSQTIKGRLQMSLSVGALCMALAIVAARAESPGVLPNNSQLGNVVSYAICKNQTYALCAEAGHHHHIAGPYLLRYAQEASWREDHRRISDGEQVDMVSGLAMKRGPSIDFCGYWQRRNSPIGNLSG
jgi:hypothetical protein